MLNVTLQPVLFESAKFLSSFQIHGTYLRVDISKGRSLRGVRRSQPILHRRSETARLVNPWNPSKHQLHVQNGNTSRG